MVRPKQQTKNEGLDLSNRVFPYPQRFEEAFPRLSRGTVEYSQTGPRGMFSYPTVGHTEYLHQSGLNLVFPIIQCNSSPVCQRGGFELWEKINLLMTDT